MRVYKHVPAHHADNFASGESIKIATYGHYRGAEGQRDDRADPLEGSAALHINERFVRFGDGRDSERERQALASMGIKVEPGARVHASIGNSTTFFRLKPQYIFCASNKPDFVRARLHGERVFEIRHILRFGRLLSAARPDLLKRFAHDKVVYENRVIDPFTGKRPVDSPFLKSTKFGFEDEYRLVWETGPLDGEFVLLRVPGAAALITEMKF